MTLCSTLVLQGGGIRCFWQAGFLTALTRSSAKVPERIRAVSAGAAIAVGFAAGTLEAGWEAFRQATAKNPKNFYLTRACTGRRLCPHEDMYRQCLMQMLDAGAMGRLQRGPQVEILICRPPEGLPTAVVLSAALAVALSRGVAQSWARNAASFTAEFVPLASCPDAAAVADLVLASSCTPPFTAYRVYRGRMALDGSLMESLPLGAPEHPPRPALVLRTTPLPASLASASGRSDATRYVGPSRPLDAAPWEYTRPDLIESFFRLGEADADVFLRETAEARSADSSADQYRRSREAR